MAEQQLGTGAGQEARTGEPRRRSPGGVWLQQRYKAWYWAIGFVVVVLLVIIALYGI